MVTRKVKIVFPFRMIMLKEERIIVIYIESVNCKIMCHQKQSLEVFCKTVFIKISQNSQEKHLRQSLFFNKVAK